MPPPNSNRGEPFLLLGLAGFLLLLLSKSYVVQSDEGHTLTAAWQLWNGRRMYDDFRNYFAPGSSYAVYWAWALTGGPSFLVARVLSLLLSFSSIVAVYLVLVKRGIRGPGLALAVVAWVVASAQYVPLNHNTFSSYAATWLLLLFLRAQERDRDGAGRLVDHVWVGVAAGGVTLFLQTKGLLLLAAVAAFTLFAVGGRRGLRAAAALVGGAVAVLAPLLLVWRPSVLLRAWFIVPVTGKYLGHTSASLSLAIACLLVAGAMAAIASRLRDRVLIAVAVMQAALLASFLYNVEPNHVAINCFPLLVFVPLALQCYAGRRPSSDAAAPAAKLSAPATMAIVVAMFTAMMATPAGRPMFKMSTLDVDFIRRVPRNPFPQPRVAAAHAIYAGPFLPGFYYQLRKKNPFFLSETVVCNDRPCQLRLLAQIQEVKPEIAFLDYEMARPLGYDENNPVDAYLRDRYVACPPSDYEGLLVRAVDPSWCP